jgi:hypothetical protein
MWAGSIKLSPESSQERLKVTLAMLLKSREAVREEAVGD